MRELIALTLPLHTRAAAAAEIFFCSSFTFSFDSPVVLD
jgi:hypothetical protein